MVARAVRISLALKASWFLLHWLEVLFPAFIGQSGMAAAPRRQLEAIFTAWQASISPFLRCRQVLGACLTVEVLPLHHKGAPGSGKAPERREDPGKRRVRRPPACTPGSAEVINFDDALVNHPALPSGQPLVPCSTRATKQQS